MKKSILIALLAIATVFSCSEDQAPTPFEGLEAVSAENLSGRTFTLVEHYTIVDATRTDKNTNIGSKVTFNFDASQTAGIQESAGTVLGDVSRPFEIVPFPNALPRINFWDKPYPSIGSTTTAYFKEGQLYLINFSGNVEARRVFDY